MMQQATARGDYTAADAYPYSPARPAWARSLIPAWAQDGGRDQMLQRFADPSQRARIVSETEQAMNARFGGAAGVFLPQTKQELIDIMRETQVSAGEAVVRLLERGNVGAILRFGSNADLVKILRAPDDIDRLRLRRVDGHASASARVRDVPARARPLRARSAQCSRGRTPSAR